MRLFSQRGTSTTHRSDSESLQQVMSAQSAPTAQAEEPSRMVNGTTTTGEEVVGNVTSSDSQRVFQGGPVGGYGSVQMTESASEGGSREDAAMRGARQGRNDATDRMADLDMGSASGAGMETAQRGERASLLGGHPVVEDGRRMFESTHVQDPEFSSPI